jgi:glycosyltransferase involved in cell wall biosynthesis
LLPSEISHSLSMMRVCQAFTDCGHDVALTGRSSGVKNADPFSYYGLRGGFRVVVNAVGGLWDNRVTRRLLIPGLVLAWKTRRLLKSFDPDMIYSRLTLAELALVPQHLPIVYEMHSLGPLRKTRLQRWAFRRLLKRRNFRRIVVTTDGLAAMMKQEVPHVEVVVARLSAEHPVPVSEEAQVAFRAAHLQGQTFAQHVGYTGNLDTFGLRGTEIICQLAARLPQVAFHVVGGEAQVVDHWRRYAQTHNRQGNIFFYGHRNPAEMPFFLGCFDVVLAPLQGKTSAEAPTGMGMSPLKLPQYLSYGKAIVASDIASHREVLSDGETALLVPDRDVDAWAEAVQTLLGDAALRARLGDKGRSHYRAGFSPEVRVKRILDGLETGPLNASAPAERGSR